MVEVKNLRLSKPKKDCDVIVDRRSVLGNPFYLRGESQRNQVCDKYELYFAEQLSVNPLFQKEIQRLAALHRTHGELNLFCWCSPKRCHAETIHLYLLNHMGMGVVSND